MPGNYVEINTSVRNDFPCPQCKTHTIKFIKNINPTESLLNRLHRITWVDEWERRGNGDRCQIIKINPDEPDLWGMAVIADGMMEGF